MTTPTVTASTRRRLRARAYIPLALLVAIQGLYIAATPSVSVRESELGQVQAGAPLGQTPGFDTAPAVGGSGPATAGTAQTTYDPAAPTAPGAGGATFDPGASPSGGGGTTAGPAPSTPAGGDAPDPVAPSATAGDTSHCTPEGRQHGLYEYQQEAVVCLPKWTGTDNGGATYQGVTGDTVKIVIFEEQPNEQVDAILNAQGLAMSEEDRQRIHRYGSDFINEHFETYGRTIEYIRFKSKCPITPPDLTTCKAEARKVIEMQPFAVIFGQQAYPEIFDEWARAGIVALGGWHFADSYFTERRPFRYDVFMTGTRSARHLVEYYCKKMARQPAANAGSIIHPQIGNRETTPRKLGILVPEDPALVGSARYIADEVSRCDGGTYQPEVVAFSRDIDRGTETTEAATAKMINTGTTTVVCWCGPIEMTGISRSFSRQGYYPEHLLPGIGLSDADVFARLYDPQQWVHAFGPSHIADSRPTTAYQSYAVYKWAGDTDNATIAALLYYLYMDLAAQGVHFAGPELNPLTYESGLLNSPGTGGGDPRSILWDWGPGDYGGYADVREVWYDPTLESDFDGARGGYHVLNDHRRFNLGEWQSTFEVPPAAQ